MQEQELKQLIKGIAVGKTVKPDFRNYLPVTTYNTNISEPIKYGKANRYFNDLVDTIHQSAIARICIAKTAAYIVGSTTTKGIITAKLLQELALQLAVFETLCFRVVYGYSSNGIDLIITKIEAVPVELVRKTQDGKFIYNSRLQMKEEKKYNQTFEDWSYLTPTERDAITIEAINNGTNYGFMYYAYMPSVGAYEYATPTWASSQDLVWSDGLMPALMKGQLENGFMPAMIITAIGDVAEQTLNEDGTVNRGSTNSIAQTVQDGIGAGNAGGTVVLTTPNPEAKIDIKLLDATKFTENAASITKLLNEGVCRIFGVPPTLAGISEAGKLGSSQQLALEVKAFNNNLQPLKQLLIDSLQEVTGAAVVLTPLQPITDVDPVLEKVLTADEVRKIFGYDPLTETADATTTI